MAGAAHYELFNRDTLSTYFSYNDEIFIKFKFYWYVKKKRIIFGDSFPLFPVILNGKLCVYLSAYGGARLPFIHALYCRSLQKGVAANVVAKV